MKMEKCSHIAASPVMYAVLGCMQKTEPTMISQPRTGPAISSHVIPIMPVMNITLKQDFSRRRQKATMHGT
jgi:hypothetical protein